MKQLILFSTTLFLISCVNIGYQPFNVMSGGYKDKPLGNNTFHISYEMYGKVEHSLVYERWHMRADELCPTGYEVLNLERNDINGSTTVATGGAFVPLSFSDPRYTGSIKCKNEPNSQRSLEGTK